MPVTYNELHQELLEQQEHLSAQVETIAHSVREEGVGYSNHMADAGTDVFEQARDVSLARQLSRSLEMWSARCANSTMVLTVSARPVVRLSNLPV